MAQKVVIDTDIILAHLAQTRGVSLLRKAMNMFFCYTTFFNAMELFSIARKKKEVEAVEHALQAMKILGVNPKSAKTMAVHLAAARKKGKTTVGTFIGAVCVESKLPVLTMHPERFTHVQGITILSGSEFSRTNSVKELLKKKSKIK
jgi:predicted nucleic acid-binding protein